MSKYIMSEIKAITKSAKKIVLKPNIKAHRKLINQEIRLYENISSHKGDLSQAKLQPLFEKMLSAMSEAEETVCKAQCNAIQKRFKASYEAWWPSQ